MLKHAFLLFLNKVSISKCGYNIRVKDGEFRKQGQKLLSYFS